MSEIAFNTQIDHEVETIIRKSQKLFPLRISTSIKSSKKIPRRPRVNIEEVTVLKPINS